MSEKNPDDALLASVLTQLRDAVNEFCDQDGTQDRELMLAAVNATTRIRDNWKDEARERMAAVARIRDGEPS